MLRTASSDIVPKSMTYSILYNQFIIGKENQFSSRAKICPDDEIDGKSYTMYIS